MQFKKIAENKKQEPTGFSFKRLTKLMSRENKNLKNLISEDNFFKVFFNLFAFVSGGLSSLPVPTSPQLLPLSLESYIFLNNSETTY